MMNTPRILPTRFVLLCGTILLAASVATGAPPVRSDGCPATDVGMLASDGSITITGDTCPSANDFENDGHDCGYGAGGMDEIFQFTVDASGYWQLDTMCVGWDTSLMVRDETGGGCPGDFHDCDGDSGHGVCGNYESDLITFLTTETTYYLVVDGWSTFTCGAFEVTTLLVQPACTSDADCDDGDFCNGMETCDLAAGGPCVPGTPPCEPYQTCDEDADNCINPDPCISWLGGAPGEYFFPTANYTANGWVADDIELRTGAGRDLISYSLDMRAEPFAAPVGTPYTVETALWTVETDTCLPETIIAGTECTITGLVVGPEDADPETALCFPSAPVSLPDNSEDFDRCEIDFWMSYRTAELGAGFVIADTNQPIGGPAIEDDVGISTMALEDYPYSGSFSLVWHENPDNIIDFAAATVCTEPLGVCCVPDFRVACQEDIFENDCAALGGSWTPDAFYAPVDCADPDGDGLPMICGDNCPNVANPDQEDCDLGTTPEGDACEADPNYADDDADGVCNGTDGCPDDPGKIDPGICGCGVPDLDSDGDGWNDCVEECDFDPLKTDPGYCGCGNPELEAVPDGDGLPDCVDQCLGVDDRIFAPGCADAIPTVSTWGMVIMALLLLVVAKLRFGVRPAENR